VVSWPFLRFVFVGVANSGLMSELVALPSLIREA